MYRALGAATLLAIAIAMPVQDAAAQDPVGGAILGGAAGAILGGAMGGGRGAAIGAIVGGATGAAIAAQGQPRPGGYRYYQQACYQQRGDGAWVVVAPEYCAPGAAAPAVEVAPQPPRGRIVRDELQDRMLELRERCEDGDRRACVRLGILIGENRERRGLAARTSGSLLLRTLRLDQGSGATSNPLPPFGRRVRPALRQARTGRIALLWRGKPESRTLALLRSGHDLT